eukprot:CAMPEP_0178952962 /NCGR_PEP_ID=MMETSP0789-20121207/8146_1 /TAXON_ID=3005 /ORGANISM="Rhizosolenia setigera, Strain CCMP 1694" /LENGTH=243 /DNA_ID=CAMNT_0020634151 /DNA_START=843 /DNA_END=1574 /DNA_ORIENTATION=-
MKKRDRQQLLYSLYHTQTTTEPPVPQLHNKNRNKKETTVDETKELKEKESSSLQFFTCEEESLLPQQELPNSFSPSQPKPTKTPLLSSCLDDKNNDVDILSIHDDDDDDDDDDGPFKCYERLLDASSFQQIQQSSPHSNHDEVFYNNTHRSQQQQQQEIMSMPQFSTTTTTTPRTTIMTTTPPHGYGCDLRAPRFSIITNNSNHQEESLVISPIISPKPLVPLILRSDNDNFDDEEDFSLPLL